MTPSDKRDDADADATSDHSQDGDPRVFAAVQEYVAAVEAGRRPDRRAFLARHRPYADEVSACLNGLAFVNSAVARMQDTGAGDDDNAVPSPTNRAAADDLAAGRPLGDFRLVREIGRGGMGVVYEAEQLSLGRRVALKILPLAAALDARQLQRFRNEAQAAAALHHTNIVPVYAVGSERSVHFYAMQLIEGQSLAEVVRALRGEPAAAVDASLTRRDETARDDAGDLSTPPVLRAFQRAVPARRPAGRSSSAGGRGGGVVGVASDTLSLDGSQGLTALRSGRRAEFYRTVARLGLQAAEALDHAHQCGIVHRDVKPANLLLDLRGKLWVADFGLARAFDAAGGGGDLTMPGDVIGTLRYMSPEQAEGRAVVLDQRTDVYSLGVTLYEFLTLQRAMPGLTREELLYQIAYVDPRPPRSVDRTIPPELETILGKAAAKVPGDRYQTAGEMADDLRRFLADEPIRARPPSAWDQAVKWTRRHRALSVAAVVVLLVVAAAASVTAVLTAREQAKTRGAYDRERARSADAERRGRQARDVVKFFTTFAAREMPFDQKLVAVRRRMLEEGLAYYQTFMAERANDPSVSAELAAAKAWTESALAELEAVDDLDRRRFDLRLASHPGVQADLKLSDAQRAALRDAGAALQRSPLAAAPVDHETMTPEQLRARVSAFAAQNVAAVDGVLTPAQRERLKQLSRQARAPSAFFDPDVAAALTYTPDQLGAVRAAVARSTGRPPEPPQDRPGERPQDRRQGMNRRQAAAVDAVLALLAADQVERYRSLVGPSFDGFLPSNERPGGGPGGGGPDGPGRFDRGPGGPGGGPPPEGDDRPPLPPPRD